MQEVGNFDEKRIAGINRNVFFLGLVSFFNDFSAEMVQSVMPTFLTVTLGAPAFVVGLIEGVADASSSVLKLFSGWFSDRIGKRKMPALSGYILSVGVRPFLALTTSFGQVLGLRVIDRVGKGFRDAPRDALIAESSPKAELGKSFGFHRSMDTVGAMLGPLLAFLLLPALNNNYRQLFLIAFAIGIGALLSFAFVREKSRRKVGTPTEASEKVPAATEDFLTKSKPKLDFPLLRANKKFVLIVAAIFVFGLGTLPILLVLLKGAEAGILPGKLPLVYFAYSATFVAAAIPLGKLADKIGERYVIAAGFLAAALAYFGLAYAHSWLTAISFFVVLGLYSAATDGLTRVLAARHVAPEILATGQGFLNMAVGLSSLIAGIIGGLLWTWVGSSAALVYAGGFSLFGAALFIFMTRTNISTNAQ